MTTIASNQRADCRSVDDTEVAAAAVVVMVLEEVVVTEWMRAVEEVLVMHTITVVANSTFNGTFANGTLYTNNTTPAYNMTGSRNLTFPAAMDPAAHHPFGVLD